MTSLVTAAKAARIQTDCSQKLVAALSIPFDNNVLSDENLLRDALLSTLITKIPVDRLIIPTSGLNVDSIFVKSHNGEEAMMLVQRFVAFEDRCAELRVGMTEKNVLFCITEVTGMMWRRMASFVNMEPVFKVQYNNDDEDFSGASGGRPNETDYLNDFMVCKSEFKDEDIQEAVFELTKKLSAYNHIEYGLKIVFLPVIAAAGADIEFAFVDVRTKAYHRVIRYDLLDVFQRVQCFVRMINYFRLIRTMAPFIPAHPTPLFKTKNNITFHAAHVMKKVSGNNNNITCPDELYELLGRGEVPGAVKVERVRGGDGGGGLLKVTPLGIRTHDRGEGLSLQDVHAAVKVVLRCVSFLHSRGFVHRDLRWANLIRLFASTKYHVTEEAEEEEDGRRRTTLLESSIFLVIDFEFAAMDGDDMCIGDYIHKDVVTYGAQYFAANDLQLVGKMVETWAGSNGHELESSALDFVHSVTKLKDPLDAGAALQHPWLQE